MNVRARLGSDAVTVARCPRCPRCGGSMARDTDLDDGRVLRCLACGRTHAMPELKQTFPPPVPAPVSAATNGAAPVPIVAEARTLLPDWQGAARRALAAQITIVQDAEQAVTRARAEATRIHAALVAYGVSDAPALPWPAAGAGAGVRKRFNYGACARCGRVFEGVRQRKNAAAGRVCRVGGCADATAAGTTGGAA